MTNPKIIFYAEIIDLRAKSALNIRIFAVCINEVARSGHSARACHIRGWAGRVRGN